MFKKVASTDSLWIGERMGVVIDGFPVLLVHMDDGVHAFQDQCPHAGALLSEGYFDGVTITCARHLWQFEAKTGKGVNPMCVQLGRYAVKVDESGDIWVDIPGKYVMQGGEKDETL